MSWILPNAAIIPAGGEIRSGGEFDRRAYDRAYYHAKRKGKPRPPLTEAQKARRRQTAREYYHRNIERVRANARANYWRHHETYAASSRERSRKRRLSTKGGT